MSRLYAWLGSDTNEHIRTIGGNEEIWVEINYGSEKDSKLAVRVSVTWLKGEEKPLVHVVLAEELGSLELKPNV